MKYCNLIFDLDGTLVDSKRDVMQHLQRAFDDYGLPFDTEKVVIGPPLNEIVQKLVPNISDELYSQIAKRFREYYNNSNFEYSVLYPHVGSIIEQSKVQGRKLFLATNKPKESTAMVLKHLSLDKDFTAIMTPNYFPDRIIKKEEMIQYLLKEYNLQKSETIMIGDAATDILAGQNAGIDTAAHLAGYENAEFLKNTNPTYSFSSFASFFCTIEK